MGGKIARSFGKGQNVPTSQAFLVDFSDCLSISDRDYGVSESREPQMAINDADSTVTDRLLKRVAAGDEQAVDELLSKYRGYLRKLIDLRMDDELRDSRLKLDTFGSKSV